MLSHDDNDHSGGAPALLAGIDVRQVISGEGIKALPAVSARCRQGQSWSWDGVEFTFLAPTGPGAGGNTASCVLRVSNRAGSLLLTGDIERKTENALVTASAGRLASTIVVAPHHGSKTSSGSALVAATRAGYVLYSAGYRNRWRMPHAGVVRRWREAGATALDTMSSGAIGFFFSADGSLHGPTRWRLQGRRYWWHTPNTR